MKIALAQIAPHSGTSRKIGISTWKTIAKARKAKVDLLVFPELSLTGLQAPRPGRIGRPGPRPLRRVSRSSKVVEPRLGPGGRFHRGTGERKKGFSSIPRPSWPRAGFCTSTASLPAHLRDVRGRPLLGRGQPFRTFNAPFGPAGLMICRDFLHLNGRLPSLRGGSRDDDHDQRGARRGLAGKKGFGSSRMWEADGRVAVLLHDLGPDLLATGSGWRTAWFFAGGIVCLQAPEASSWPRRPISRRPPPGRAGPGRMCARPARHGRGSGTTSPK